MNFESTILNELKEISPALAQMAKLDTPYLVPENYFNSLSNNILQRINEPGEALGRLSLSNIQNDNAYSVPAGYFEGFSSKMLDLVRNQKPESPNNELAEIAPLLSGMDRKMPFSVPAGYFDRLPVALGNSIASISEEVYPVLTGLNQKPTYAVPESYFEHLPAEIMAKLHSSRQPAKIVSFGRRWMRMAAAAAITGLLVTGAFLSYQAGNSNQSAADPIKELSGVSDQEIINFMQNQDLPAVESGGTNMAISNFTDNDVKDLMSDVSDAELEQYAQSQDPQSN